MMTQPSTWQSFFAETADLFEDVKARLRAERAALISSAPKPQADWGDPRLQIVRMAEFPHDVAGWSDTLWEASEGFDTDEFIGTGSATGLDQWVAPSLYKVAKAELLRNWPEIDKTTLRSALIELVPHIARVVGVVWSGSAVLMELKYRYTEPKPMPGLPHVLQRQTRPSDRIGLLHGPVFPERGIEGSFLDLIKTPFMGFGKAYGLEVADTWSVHVPDGPEVHFMRHAELTGVEPSAFHQGWQEGGTYPYLFVEGDALEEALDDDTERLKAEIDGADKAYRAAARALDKKIVVEKSCHTCQTPREIRCESIPVKRMLNYDDGLELDDVSETVIGKAL